MASTNNIDLYQRINSSLSTKECSFKVQWNWITVPTVQTSLAQIYTSLIDLLGGHPSLIEVI